MPATLSYPGVYIEEASSGVHTITGVATSIAAFFGRTRIGPINKAVRCLSYADFVRNFGSSPAGSELAMSVKQFYDNGGSDCYVVRLTDDSASKASVDLNDLWGQTVLRATAKMAGSWGNGVRLEVDYNTPNPGETFNLKVIWEEGNRVVARETFPSLSMDRGSGRYAPDFVTQSSSLIDLALYAPDDAPPFTPLGDPSNTGSLYNTGSFPGYSEARCPLGGTAAEVKDRFNELINPATGNRNHSFDISVDGSAYVTVSLSNMTSIPPSITGIHDTLKSIINTELGRLVPARQVSVAITKVTDANNQYFLRITSDNPGGPNTSIRIRRAPTNDIAAPLLWGVDNGGVELARWSNFRPAPTGTILHFHDGSGSLNKLNTLAGLEQNALTEITIGTESSISLSVAPNNICTTGTSSNPFYIDGKPGDSPSHHHDGVREKLRIIARAISNTSGSHYRADVYGYQLVIYAKDGGINEKPSSVDFSGPGAGAVNGNFQTNVRSYTLGTTGVSSFTTAGLDGNDGGAPQFSDYIGNAATKTGLYALDEVDIFNLIVLPMDSGTPKADRQNLWGPASIYCQARRAFLLIDTPDGWTTSDGHSAIIQDTSQADDLRARVIKDHSAVFYPKIKFNDGGVIKTVGPTGAIAGVIARTDASRGVWKAPAGTEADLRGIAGLEVKLTDLENGVLNKLGVNCLRNFPSGFVNWGARTMDGSDAISSDWKYIPIRRLALFIEESLYRGTKWVVFEPNDEPLWAKIRLNVGVFMNGLFRQGAFQGSTPDKAFYVKCDSETTTQADRNLGIVNIEVGFAPLKPAEFVVITIQQIAGNLQ